MTSTFSGATTPTHQRKPSSRFHLPSLTPVSWRRLAKYGFGAGLLAIGGIATYDHVILHTSREAVINGPVVLVRAPIDGVVSAAGIAPGASVIGGSALGTVEDSHADDARVFAIQQESDAAHRDRDAALERLADLERARAEAISQSDAYQVGRVHQTELRVQEAQASLAAALARQAEASSAAQRSDALYTKGFQSVQAQERALHAAQIAQQETVAARKRLDALVVELEAARRGTYLGDNYNDVPSSFQRARELRLRIDETTGAIKALEAKVANLGTQLSAERKRLEMRSSASLQMPLTGVVWSVHARNGEYVRKGQDVVAVLDCTQVAVTASVSERDYNRLHVGDPVRFRVGGTGREYAGTIAKLGLTSTGSTFAISPEEHHHQVAVDVPALATSAEDRCAVGRVGQVVF